MRERVFSYKGPLVVPEGFPHLEGVSELLGVTAVFNGPLWKIHDTIYCMPRMMYGQQGIPGKPDTTDSFGLFEVKLKGLDNSQNISATKINEISSERIKGSQLLNPEDARAFIVTDKNGKETGEVFFGLTAADEKSIPYPAIFSGTYPFGENDFAQMEVLQHIPAGKNVLPLAKDLLLYRPEYTDGKENGNRFVFLRKNADGTWKEERSIEFPNASWVGEDGRFGLVGGEKIWMDTEKGLFRMIIHGLKRYKNEEGHDIVEYALGLGEFSQRADNTFDVLTIDNQPFFTYAEAVGQIGQAKEPNASKKVIYSVGSLICDDEVLVALTAYDKMLGLFGFPRKRLTEPFA